MGTPPAGDELWLTGTVLTETVEFWLTKVSVAARGVTLVLALAITVTVPEPTPELLPVIVSQLAPGT